jgi:hypothetical protein
MSTRAERSFVQRYLDPSDRLDELLFGLIMVLSITLGVSVATDEGGGASEMVWAIVGCNLAWGLIDGGMYMVMQLFDRSRRAQLIKKLNATNNQDEQLTTVGSVLDEYLTALTSADERRALYLGIARRLRAATIERTHLVAADFYGALALVWLMVVVTVPAVLPFLYFTDRFTAARASNAVVLLMLFAVGFKVARTVHVGPWALGLSTTVFGLAMVVIAMLLGG